MYGLVFTERSLGLQVTFFYFILLFLNEVHGLPLV